MPLHHGQVRQVGMLKRLNSWSHYCHYNSQGMRQHWVSRTEEQEDRSHQQLRYIHMYPQCLWVLNRKEIIQIEVSLLVVCDETYLRDLHHVFLQPNEHRLLRRHKHTIIAF